MKKEDNKIGFARKEINELMTKFRIDNDLRPACMVGFHKDLKNMKERIKEKLDKNIEKILEKEELTKDDVRILENKLNQIESKEMIEKSNEKLEMLCKSMMVN